MIEIRFSGFGGQGIIKCGYIVGTAASIYDTKHATMTQSFGPEARGSACSSQLLVSDDRILYPYINKPQILVSMSQEAFEKYEPNLVDNGILIIDEDLVRPKKLRSTLKVYSMPATRFSEQLGNKIIANVVMLGFFTAVTGVVTPESMKKAIPDSVPERAVNLNLRAFDRGYEYGKEYLKKKAS